MVMTEMQRLSQEYLTELKLYSRVLREPEPEKKIDQERRCSLIEYKRKKLLALLKRVKELNPDASL